MSNDDVKKFATDKGYNDVKEVGNFHEYRVFVPMFKETRKIIGYPKYILVKDNEIIIKTDITMEITKVLVNSEEG